MGMFAAYIEKINQLILYCMAGSKFINSFNYFRGIASMFIVAVHCFKIVDLPSDNFGENMLFNLIGGGTTLFVFISGFLFHYVFYEKFNYKNFMKKKILLVLLPYTIVSFLPYLYFTLTFEGPNESTHPYYFASGDGYFNYYVIPFLKRYITGHQVVAYWYIPFTMVLFAFAPLYAAFVKLNFKLQLLVAFIFLLISVFIHRPLEKDAFSVVHAIFSFTPVYLIGIMCSEKRDYIYSNFLGKEWIFLAASMILAVFSLLSGHVGKYEKDPFIYDGVDLMLLQKILLSIFFMIFLYRFEGKKYKMLDKLATNSFGIFFVHPLLIIIIMRLKDKLGFFVDSYNLIWYVFVTLFVYTASYVIVSVVKKITGKNSRYVIGS